MRNYLYDETFDGLLTCIYRHYYQEKAAGIYPAAHYQASLEYPSSEVNTCLEQAEKVYKAIEKKTSAEALQKIYYVFLSDTPQKENLILHYLLLAFRIGAKIDLCHTQPQVLPVEKIHRKVTRETHRIFGLLRFADLGPFLYAEVEPDHNLLILLADHFTDRLAGENFMIHDTKRKTALIYDQKEWYMTPFQEQNEWPYSEKELFYRTLWREYFTSIGIEARKNSRLQAQFVPERYRKNLVEFCNSMKSTAASSSKAPV